MATRSFTVRLDEEDYERLGALADNHRPILTKQYVVQYAIRLLLKRAEDPQLRLRLGDPLIEEDDG